MPEQPSGLFNFENYQETKSTPQPSGKTTDGNENNHLCPQGNGQSRQPFMSSES
jgi:hypothetical protein